MNNIKKAVFVIFALSYLVLPDLVPGYIDDLLVVVLSIVAQKRSEQKKEYY